MLKLFFRNSFFFFIVQVVSYVVSFFLLPLYTAHLSKADYGALEMLNVIILIVQAAGCLQIQQGVARYLPDHSFANPAAKKNLISTGFLFSVGAFTLCSLTGYVFDKWLCLHVIGSLDYIHAFDLSMLQIWLLGIANYMQLIKVYQMQGKSSAIASICSVFVTIPLTIFLVIKAKWGVTGITLANIAGQLVIIAVLMREALPQIKFRIDRKLLATMLRFSSPLVLSSLAYMSWSFMDRIMLNKFLSLDELGLFSVGAKFSVPFTAMLSIFETSLFPIVINQYHKRQTPAKVEKLASVLLLITIVLWLGMCIYAKQILSFMVAPGFRSAWSIIGLSVGALVFTRLGFLAPGISIAKKTKFFVYLTIVTSVLNAGLNFLLIPRLGIIGAPLATFFSSIVYLIVIFRKSQQLYPLPYRFGSIVTAILLVVGIVAGVYFGETRFSGAGWLALKTAVFVVLSFVIYKLLITKSLIALVTRLVKKRRPGFKAGWPVPA